MKKLMMLIKCGMVVVALIPACGCAGTEDVTDNDSYSIVTDETEYIPEIAADEMKEAAEKEKEAEEIMLQGYAQGADPIEELVAPEEISEPAPDIWNDDELIYENGIFFHKDVSEANKEIFYSCYEKEPYEVRMALDYYEAAIVVGADSAYTGGNAGTYYAEDRIIAIDGSTGKKIDMAVNHEIGHCVDAMVGEMLGMMVDADNYWLGVSNTDEFRAIYEAEVKNAGYPSWNSTDTFEFFAETYRYVIEDNKTMLSKAPQAAQYVRSILEHYYMSN